jgi:hypothetical protein
MRLEDVKEQYAASLLRLPNVVGVGIGERRGQPVIKVLVSRKLSRSVLLPTEMIPAQLEGYDVDVEAIGILNIEAQN